MREEIKKIVQAIEKQGLSGNKAAALAQLPQKTVSNLLSGRTQKPSIELIEKLQTVLNISEPSPVYAVSKVIEGLSPEEAEALRIMRECPEALSVVRMMGAVDSDTQKDIQRIAETEKRTFEKLRQLQGLKKA